MLIYNYLRLNAKKSYCALSLQDLSVRMSLNGHKSLFRQFYKEIKLNMKTPYSHSIAEGLNTYLLAKMDKFLTKKLQLAAQMNANTLDQLATIITQANQQINYAVEQSSIKDVQDLETIKLDSLMSVPQSRVIGVATLDSKLSPFSSIQQTKRLSLYSRSRRGELGSQRSQRSQRSRSITPHSQAAGSRKTSFSSNSRVFQVLDLDKGEEEERYVQALRVNKKLQEQRVLRQLKMAEQLREKRLSNDWSNKKVMFDFECRITRIEDFRAKKSLKLGRLDPRVHQTANVHSNEWAIREDMTQEVKDKVNVTLRTQQEQQTKLKRRGLFRAGQSLKTEPSPPAVIVNFETHEETEGAIRLLSDGIKLKLNHRQFSTINDPPAASELTIKSKMNRSQYLEFKKVHQSRKGKIMVDRVKPRSKSEFKIRDEAKNQGKSEEEQRNAKLEELQAKSESENRGEPKISMVLGSTNRDTSVGNQSRVKVFNKDLHKQLLREEKRKHVSFLVQNKHATAKSKRQRLSEVDKYNLLYLKHGGNPPDYLDEVAESLKTSTVELSKDRESLVKGSLGKDYNWVGTSRIVERKERLKTTNA